MSTNQENEPRSDNFSRNVFKSEITKKRKKEFQVC